MAISTRTTLKKSPGIQIGGGGGNALMGMMMRQSMKGEDRLADLESKMAEQEQARSLLGEDSVVTKAVGGNVTSINPEMARKTTAESMNQLSKIKQMKNALQAFQSIGEQLPAGLARGGIEQFASNISKGNLGSPNMRTYLQTRESLAASIYRVITGDTRLSDFDAKRALSLIWEPAEPEDVRTQKNAFLNYLLNEAETSLSPTMVSTPEESSRKFNEFIDLLQNKYTDNRVLPNASGVQGNQNIQRPSGDNRISVVNLKTGKRGSISEKFFDPNKYQKV